MHRESHEYAKTPIIFEGYPLHCFARSSWFNSFTTFPTIAQGGSHLFKITYKTKLKQKQNKSHKHYEY